MCVNGTRLGPFSGYGLRLRKWLFCCGNDYFIAEIFILLQQQLFYCGNDYIIVAIIILLWQWLLYCGNGMIIFMIAMIFLLWQKNTNFKLLQKNYINIAKIIFYFLKLFSPQLSVHKMWNSLRMHKRFLLNSYIDSLHNSKTLSHIENKINKK